MTQMAGTAGRPHRPVLITDAGMSREEEYARRRRRYGLLMAGRVVCIIGAFVAGTVLSNLWVAGALIAGAAALPWAAVLIANDRLPKEKLARRTPAADVAPDHQLTAPAPGPTSEHRVIEM